MRLALGLIALIACGADDVCVEDLDLACTPLYEPTFDEVYANTLKPTCGISGSSCHAAEGNKGGYTFDDPDDSYEQLIDSAVFAQDAACSPLITRLEAEDPADAMPPGQPLAEAERCAIRQWVDNGAER